MRKIYSEKLDLVNKSREAMLSAVQIYNNPLTSFKTESFIVLSLIAWTYLLHAYYRGKKIEYRYFELVGRKRKFIHNSDGSIRYWDLNRCISEKDCPLDDHTKNNLTFLVGLRNQVEHKKATGLDSYLSARYQACALNFNYYLKKLHGGRFGLDNNLALSLQFAELDYDQSKVIKDKENLIPQDIISYVAAFDNSLSESQVQSDRFAYRLLFTKLVAKRKGQADRVIEFIDPKSDLANKISKDYWVKEEVEKPKLLASRVIEKIQAAGFKDFKMHQHTMLFWKEHDGKNPNNGFGTLVERTWYWYENWVNFVIAELTKNSVTQG